ncbi:MAG: hypothetical protein JSS30_00385 [Verrucomicrobia bacterium]|nr:hypothetical protein [Verrucomicrobiota bacterium]
MTNSTPKLQGIGKKSRSLLSQVVRKSDGFINSALVQKVLNIPKAKAKLYLSRWAQAGWLKRIQRGSYIPIDMEVQDLSLVMEDPWIIASGMFSPCYIGGWTAAHYWELTDQLFTDILVLSTHPQPRSERKIGDHVFIVRKIPLKRMFGLKIIYRDKAKVQISDLHKTIVDILDNPSIGGGIRSALDFLESYLRSPDKDVNRVLDYAKKMNNKAIFKRMGYLLTILKYPEASILAQCETNMSQGYSQLDPSAKGKKLIKKWRLWVPEELIQNSNLEEQ